MEKKMTSGEIAEKTGVSQKALRLYDEKGLLKRAAKTLKSGGMFSVNYYGVVEEYFTKLLEKDGQVVVDIATIFYHCYK